MEVEERTRIAKARELSNAELEHDKRYKERLWSLIRQIDSLCAENGFTFRTVEHVPKWVFEITYIDNLIKENENSDHSKSPFAQGGVLKNGLFNVVGESKNDN